MCMFAQDGAFYRGVQVDLTADPEPLHQPLTTAAVCR